MPKIVWQSPVHKQRFSTAMQDIGKVYNGRFDSEYASAIYILTADYHMWDMVKQYVSQDGIDFEDIVQNIDLTHGTSILVHLAGNLFNGGLRSNPQDIAGGTLDDRHYQLAISAIHLRYYGLSVDDVRGATNG